MLGFILILIFVKSATTEKIDSNWILQVDHISTTSLLYKHKENDKKLRITYCKTNDIDSSVITDFVIDQIDFGNLTKVRSPGSSDIATVFKLIYNKYGWLFQVLLGFGDLKTIPEKIRPTIIFEDLEECFLLD